MPAIHLEDPSEVHVIKKRSLDQQLRIKLYYDESVYRFVASLTMKILKHHLCHLWSNTNIEQVRPSTSIELYYDESVYRFVASLTMKILKHHLCHLWSNTNIEQVRPSTSIELYYDESVYRFVASLTKKILKHLAPLTKL